MKKIVVLCILLLASLVYAQETDTALHHHSASTGNIKPATRLLPIGDALAFGSIGIGFVIWLRKRRTL